MFLPLKKEQTRADGAEQGLEDTVHLQGVAMGKHFGELAKINGIVYFRLSPHEQNPLAGMISRGVPNMIRRIRGRIFRVVPPFVATYFLYVWGNAYNKQLARKNPKDFENDT